MTKFQIIMSMDLDDLALLLYKIQSTKYKPSLKEICDWLNEPYQMKCKLFNMGSKELFCDGEDN